MLPLFALASVALIPAARAGDVCPDAVIVSPTDAILWPSCTANNPLEWGGLCGHLGGDACSLPCATRNHDDDGMLVGEQRFEWRGRVPAEYWDLAPDGTIDPDYHLVTDFDEQGRVSSYRYAVRHTHTYSYDENGRLEHADRGWGEEEVERTTFTWTDEGQLAREAGGRSRSYGYADGRLVSWDEGLGLRGSIHYDEQGRLLRRESYGGRVVALSYDAQGRVEGHVLTVEGKRELSVRYPRDERGRVTAVSRTWYDDSPPRSFDTLMRYACAEPQGHTPPVVTAEALAAVFAKGATAQWRVERPGKAATTETWRVVGEQLVVEGGHEPGQTELDWGALAARWSWPGDSTTVEQGSAKIGRKTLKTQVWVVQQGDLVRRVHASPKHPGLVVLDETTRGDTLVERRTLVPAR